MLQDYPHTKEAGMRKSLMLCAKSHLARMARDDLKGAIAKGYDNARTHALDRLLAEAKDRGPTPPSTSSSSARPSARPSGANRGNRHSAK